jgi:hypothetical protein
MKKILFLEVKNTNLSNRIKHIFEVCKIKYLFQIILYYPDLIKFKNLGKKSLAEIDEFLDSKSRKKVEAIIFDAAKRAGENRLADVNTFWGSNQFQMFNEKYENFKSNSKVKRVKPLGVLKFSEIFDIYTLSINRDVVLKNIKPTYRKEFSEWYFPKYEIQKTYFELIKKELQKPD